jgi:hypothetical protein
MGDAEERKQYADAERELKEEFGDKLEGYKLVKPWKRDRVEKGMFVKYNKIGTDKLTVGIVTDNDEHILSLQSTNKSFTWKISFASNYVFYKRAERNAFKKVVINLLSGDDEK